VPTGNQRQRLARDSSEPSRLSTPSPATTALGLGARESSEGHGKSDDADPSRPALNQRDEQDEGNDKSENGCPALPRYGHATDAVALLGEPGFSRPHCHRRRLPSSADNRKVYLPGSQHLQLYASRVMPREMETSVEVLGHEDARGSGRIAGDAAEFAPAVALVEFRRLEVDRVEHRAAAAAPHGLLLHQ